MLRFWIIGLAASLFWGAAKELPANTVFEEIRVGEELKRRTRAERLREVRPRIFKMEEHGFSVVCMGGSPTYGFPLPYRASFPAVLERMLLKEKPEWTPLVLSMGSLRGSTEGLLGQLPEVLALKPSLVVLEVGATDGLQRLQVQDIPNEGFGPLSWTLKPIPWDHEVHSREKVREKVNHSIRNTRELIRRLKKSGLEVVLLHTGSNLKHAPIADHGALETTDHLQREIEQVLRLEEDTEKTHPDYSMRCMERVIQLAPRSPSFRFRYAKKLERYGRVKKAFVEYARALDMDHDPLRWTADMREALALLAEEEGVVFLDGLELSRVLLNIETPGFESYADAFHPGREMHLAIARALLRTLGVESDSDPEDFKGLWSWSPSESGDYWRGVSRSLAFLGLYPGALDIQSQAVEKDPLHRKNMAWLAHLYDRQHRVDDFIFMESKIREKEIVSQFDPEEAEFLAEGVAFQGGDPSPWLKAHAPASQAWYGVRGMEAAKAEKHEDAVSHLMRAVDEQPQNRRRLLALLGTALEGEALEVFLAKISQNFHKGWGAEVFQRSLDRIYAGVVGHPKRAMALVACLEEYHKVLEGKDLKVWLHLAYAHSQAGDHSKAAEVLKEILADARAEDRPLNFSLVEGFLRQAEDEVVIDFSAKGAGTTSP